jgi:hypothetical protein
MGAAIGKEFVQFFTVSSFANSCGIKAVGEDTLPTASQSCWERIFPFFCFFLSTFLWVLPTITTSKLQNLGMF